jgi:hypothetical protein
MAYYPYATGSLLPLVWPEQAETTLTGENTLYYVARQRMLTGLFNWVTMSPYAFLLTDEYTFDPLHETVADLPAAARLSTAVLLHRSVNAHGYLCSIGVEFVNVLPSVTQAPAGNVVFAEGSAEASKLIVCFNDVTELPFIPNGRSWFMYPNSSEVGLVTGSGGWFTP